MRASVTLTENPAEALAAGHDILLSRPVFHTLPLTLLEGRVRTPEAGRYWIVRKADRVVGIALQSPLNFPVVLSRMPASAVRALVRHAHLTAAVIPAATGDARTVARFAGEWVERTKASATVKRALRLYEAATVVGGPEIPGCLRVATVEDHARLVPWVRGFFAEIGEAPPDIEALVAQRTATGNVWVWDDDGPRTMAALSAPAAGVVRVAMVFTPVEHRRRGLARACVEALTRLTVSSGYRCALFADLANPSANALYRRIGYRPVAEFLTFEFNMSP